MGETIAAVGLRACSWQAGHFRTGAPFTHPPISSGAIYDFKYIPYVSYPNDSCKINCFNGNNWNIQLTRTL